VAVIEQTLRRQAALEAARQNAGSQCKAPGPPMPYGPDTQEGRQIAMSELVVAALACGITRVATVHMCATKDFDGTYSGLGYTMGCHGLGHGGKDPKWGNDWKIHEFHAEVIARMADRLKEIPDGNGTLMDSTVIVWINNNGTSHHARTHHPWIVTLVGSAGGALRTGRYLRLASRSDDDWDHHLCDVWTTLVNAADVRVDHFQPNTPTRKKGVVAAMLA
jgi:hypothetical protein